ncbi:MAG: ABC transporter ATP-binding protein [Rickettsiales bacterium]|nr:ABC transporter ATP-binding protein [Rickettsiales bacterium]
MRGIGLGLIRFKEFSPRAKAFLWEESRKRKRSLALLFTLTLIGTFLELLGIGMVFPIILIKINPEIIHSHKLFQHLQSLLGVSEVKHMIYWLTGFMVTTFFFRNLHLIFLTYMRSRMISEWKEDMAREMVQKYMRAPYPYIIKKTSAVLIRSVEMTGTVFDRVVISLISLASNFILVFAIVALVATIQPLVTIMSAISLFALISIQNRYLKDALVDAGDMTSEGELDSHKALQQSIGVARECRLMGKTGFFLDHFTRSRKKLSKAYVTSQVLRTMPPLLTQFMLIVIISVMLLVLLNLNDSNAAFPSLGLMAMAAFRLAPRFNNIQHAFNSLYEGSKALEKVAKEVEELNDISPLANHKISLIPLRNSVKLEDVYFSYSGKKPWLFKEVNLTIRAGDFIGFMGASGAGKSTIIDILLGLLPPSRGQVVADGQVLLEGNAQKLLKAGFVSQNPFFSSGSLKQNIAFGVDTVDETRVIEVLKMVGLYEVIQALPDGIDSNVGENAGQFSGGQRQRIAIARALYADPDFLVLDEPTSALDAESEIQIIDLLQSLKGKRTIILITHRPGNLRYCNQFIFLHEGQIESADQLDQLMRSNKAFTKMMDQVAIAGKI